MRLRQIKLAGFKSFADPAHLELNRPLVGIVGPNGCGKSNVIDAVRWVLGEARASELRGGSMKELIFAGSTGRKPLGRASVELSLTNEDGRIKGPWGEFAELNVKRLVTSEGQSSYYINNQHVRRRDIQDLFLGTGLGPRSYAIISQGMISNFIKARPEELRVYLEEAAGVSLYRERRKETESLLTQTRSNLERVSDMQAVKEEEASRLESEAQTAREWKRLTEERNEAEAMWYWIQYEDVRHTVEHLNAECAQAEAAIEERKGNILEKEDETPVLEEALRLSTQRAAEATLALRLAEKELTQAEAERRRREERREKALSDRQDAQVAASKKKADIQKAEDELAQNERLKIDLDLDVELAQEETVALEEDCERLEEEARAAKSEADRRLVLASEEETRRRVAKSEADHARKAADDCAKRLLRLSEQKNELSMPSDTQIRAMEEDLRDIESELEEARADAIECEESLLEARSLKDVADEAYFSLLSEEKEIGAKLEALEEVELKSAGAGLLGEFEKKEGLDGLLKLTDDLTIEPKWVTAVEAILGDRVRAKLLRNLSFAGGYEKKRPPAPLIFVDGSAEQNSPQAPLIIEGQAFPPLTEKLSSGSAAVIRASAQWFDQVWCAENLSSALAVRDHLKNGQYVVTPYGDRVGAASLEIWAAEDPGTSVLSRRQEIEQLREKLFALQEASGIAQKRRYETKTNADHLETAERVARERLKRLEGEFVKLTAEAQALAQRRALVEKHLDDLRRNRAEIEQERDEAEALYEEALESCDSAQFKADEAKRASIVAQEKAARVSEKFKQTSDVLNRRRREVDMIRAQIRQLEQAKGFLNARIESFRTDLCRETERLAVAQAVLDETEQLPADNKELEAIGRVQNAETLARETTQNRQVAQDMLEENRRLIRQWQTDLVPMSEALGVKRVERQVKESLCQQFSERLDELKADRDFLAKKVLERPVKAQSMRSRVQQLASRIAALGPVNHAALEHLEAVRRILEETAKQVADLEKGIETLEAAIRKIDGESRGRMKETFGEVNRNFDETFKDLFGGGEAALSWEGEDILTAGIGVRAQPPGKRNASVKQLSGGEQALTATALVFAIFKLNPAPFCLLDEVDAPLDEANQARLAGMCQRMSVKTQFLMITHHRVTMEYAGALVGVTMKEPGVSRIVSVDIENAVKMSE